MKTISRYIMTLALLLTAVTGAWAQYEFSSDPYTSTTEFNSVSVTSSMTLTIKEGVIVTVNSGLTIEDGVTLTLTGGGRLSVYGKTGNWGRDAVYEEGNRIIEATAGGDGQPAIILNDNAKIVIDNGEIYAEGGQGGRGGEDATAGINQPDGAAGNAFSRFPTIDGATLYYKKDFSEWFKYTSGDKTLYRVMKALPTTFEVTLNEAKTIASFEMPTSDVTMNYELVRDMSYKVAFSGVPTRARLAKDGEGKFHFADGLTFQLLDNIDAANPKDITSAEGITFMVGEVEAVVFEGNTFYQLNKETLVPLADFLADAHLGNYAICAVASTGEYDGSFSSGMITLFEGYEVTIPAGEYITYYRDEPLKLDDNETNAELYTISAVGTETATLSGPYDAMKALTPMLVHNKNTEEAKTILLIPCNEPDLALTVAPEFKGTLEATEIAASSATSNNYAFNGKQFVWVKTALAVGQYKAWLEVPTGTQSAPILTLVFGDATKITTTDFTDYTDGVFYDLNGRKLQGKPTKKGVYIMNGKKYVNK